MKIRRLALALLAFSVSAASQDQPPAGSDPANTATSSSDTANNPSFAGEATAANVPKLDLTPDPSGKLSQEQMQGLLRVVARNYRDNSRKMHNYTYIERDVERKVDGHGEIKSTETKTYEVMQLYDEQVARLIEKDDKPLDLKAAAKEEQRIQKLADKRKNESDEERKKREAEQEKQREKGREFLMEVADAYTFQLAGSESLNGRDAWVIDGEPRADFRAKLKEGEILSKIHGRLWIDKTEMQLVKMDISVLDTISFGWVLARIHGGTRFEYEQTRVNDEVWLPLHYEAKLDARVALFKSENELAEGSYRDYKKFRTSAKILSVGEVKDQN